jgi:hypothetical protein
VELFFQYSCRWNLMEWKSPLLHPELVFDFTSSLDSREIEQ